MKKHILLATAFAPLFSLSAAAALINVDFNGGDYGPDAGPTYAGAAVTGSSGDVWNGFDSSQNTLSLAPLKDSTGATTSVTLSYSGVNQYNDNGGSNTSPFIGTSFENLMQEFLLVFGGNSATFTLANLPASTEFNLYLYSASNGAGNDRVGNFKLDAANGGGASSVTFDNTVSVFTPGTNYTLLNGTTDALGTVKFSLDQTASSSEGDLNGFQIVTVPEPSSYAMLFAGFVFFFYIVRRYRARTILRV